MGSCLVQYHITGIIIKQTGVINTSPPPPPVVNPRKAVREAWESVRGPWTTEVVTSKLATERCPAEDLGWQSEPMSRVIHRLATCTAPTNGVSCSLWIICIRCMDLSLWSRDLCCVSVAWYAVDGWEWVDGGRVVFCVCTRFFAFPVCGWLNPGEDIVPSENASITINFTISKTAHDTTSHIGHTSPSALNVLKGWFHSNSLWALLTLQNGSKMMARFLEFNSMPNFLDVFLINKWHMYFYRVCIFK